MAVAPIHLAGNNAPVQEEVDAVPTRVVGGIPPGLHGVFLRNGPNPRSGWSPHLFAGDGMVHAIALEDGVARWYRNRYVRTPLYADPSVARGHPRVTTANTNVIVHAGRLLALEEGGFPYELTQFDLETVGPFTFDGGLRGPMTAHPKRCPVTGDLLFFGYSVARPHLVFHRAAADGRLTESRAIDLPACTMHHDFAITDRFAAFVDGAYTFDLSALATGSPWRWDGDRPTRIGLLPRDGSAAVRWWEVEPCHLSHAANAWDDGDDVVLVGTRIDGPSSLPVLHEWRIDTATGRVSERVLDDRSTEYPRVHDDVIGRRSASIYTSGFFLDAEPDHGEVVLYDVHGGIAVHRFPTGHTCGEPVPVDRYLLTFVHDRVVGTSYLAVLDADDVAAAPIAEVHLPVRVPGGFHGSWVPTA